MLMIWVSYIVNIIDADGLVTEGSYEVSSYGNDLYSGLMKELIKIFSHPSTFYIMKQRFLEYICKYISYISQYVQWKSMQLSIVNLAWYHREIDIVVK